MLGLDEALGWNTVFFLMVCRKKEKKCSGCQQHNANTKSWLATCEDIPFCFPFALDWCESTLNCPCLIILSYIAVYNRDTNAHVSLANVSIVGVSVIMWKLQYANFLTLKTPRKPASENIVCLCRLLNILANFSNLFLHIGKQCGPRLDWA